MDQRSTFSLSVKAMLQHHDTLQNNALLCCFLVDKNNKSQVNSSKTILQTILIHRFPAANYIQTQLQLFFFKTSGLLHTFLFYKIPFPPRLAETRLHNLRLRGHFPQDREGEAFHLFNGPTDTKVVTDGGFFRFKPFLRLGGKQKIHSCCCLCVFFFV